MTPSDLAHDLSTLVATVDGVTGLYDARPAVIAAITGAIGQVRHIAPVDPVLVEERPSGIAVTVAISVSDRAPAADTSRRVYESLDAWLEAHPEAPPVDTITVRVGRVG